MSFKQDSKAFGGLFFWLIATILALAIAFIVLIFAFGGVSNLTAAFRGETAAKNQTVGNGDFRNQSYNKFFDQCNAIVSAQQNLVIAGQAPDAHTPNTIDNTNYVAQQRQLNDLVNQYNADASKTGTAGQFRDSSLPYHINPTDQVTCS